MTNSLPQTLFEELDRLVLIDPHTHIQPQAPAASTLADVLGYHYYTELAHSAGMPRNQIEEAGLDPKEKVRRLVDNLQPLANTIQYSWLIELAQKFFGFEDEQLTPKNWEALYDRAAETMAQPDWPDQVLAASGVESVFLTNDFDDDLTGFDTNKYIPCLRTDDLVFHLAKPEVRQRLAACTNVEPCDADSIGTAIGKLFDTFTSHGARACAISLPPDFSPAHVDAAAAKFSVDQVLTGTANAAEHATTVSRFVFWTLAEQCAARGLPFDLMIGVNRNVYPAGVHQGRDLFDSRVSLIQYQELFNAFPTVKFPISVLASVTNQELVAYSWIFPNVICNGHWWYSNTPSYIRHDLSARLEAVPQTKQIGYYSDAYKLEFVQPKFAMYKRQLARVLAEEFVVARNWSEARALDLGRQVLRGNVEAIFPARS